MSQRTAAGRRVVTTRKSTGTAYCGGDPGRPGREAGHQEWISRPVSRAEGCSSSPSRDGTTPARRRRVRRSCSPSGSGSSRSPRSTPSSTSTTSSPGRRSSSATTACAGSSGRAPRSSDPAASRPRGRGARHRTRRGHAPRAPRRRARPQLEGLRRRARRRRARRRHRGHRDARRDAGRRAAHAPALGVRVEREPRGARRARRRALELRGPGRHPQRHRRPGRARRHPDGVALGVGAPLRAQRAVTEGRARAARQARGAHRASASRAATSRPRRRHGRRASTRSPPTTRTWRATSRQLEQARDAVDAPEASGEAIAQEFERYLRRRGDGPRGTRPTGARARATSPGVRATARARQSRGQRIPARHPLRGIRHALDGARGEQREDEPPSRMR